MKHIFLIATIALFILSIVAGDSRIQIWVNHKCNPGYSDTDNPRANDKIEKSKQDEYSGLRFSIGIVMPANSL